MYGHVVLASTKKGFVPNAIKWFTRSKFSHSLVTLPDMLGAPLCIEAAEGGVDAVRFDNNYANDPGQGYQVWRVKIDQSIKDAAIVSVLNDLEIRYGLFQFAWFMWRALNRLFGRDVKNQDNWNHDGMICSQLCVAYLTSCGLGHLFQGYGQGSVAPQDLQDIFMAHPELFELVQEVRLAA